MTWLVFSFHKGFLYQNLVSSGIKKCCFRPGFALNKATLLASSLILLIVVAVNWSVHSDENTLLPGKWAMISFNWEFSQVSELTLPLFPTFHSSHLIKSLLLFGSVFQVHLTFDLFFPFPPPVLKSVTWDTEKQIQYLTGSPAFL